MLDRIRCVLRNYGTQILKINPNDGLKNGE